MDLGRGNEHRELLAQRLKRLGVIVGSLFLAVATGYWYAQVVQAAHYRQLSENNRLRQSSIRAPRGLVQDRHGRLLAENVPSYNLRVDTESVRDVDRMLAFAAGVLDIETELLREQVDLKAETFLLAEELDLSQVSRFESAALEHPEFRIDVLQRRLYRHGSQTAHLLGYLGEVTEQELERRGDALSARDLIGKEGVELAFDGRLRGRDGRQEAIVDSRGRTIELARRDPAVPGERLRLTIDLDLQQEAELQMQGRVGAVVALDPRSGAIRALYSSPSYDPNLFTRRLVRSEWQALLDAPHRPLQDRALESTYPPGSVFKVVMALAGLSEGVINPSDRVYCGGSIRLHGRPRRCWKRAGHGSVDLHDAIKYSCDVYFYVKGQELGIDRIAEHSRRLGLGTPTGLDIPGEKAGLVPDTEWSRRVRGHIWYPGETISVAIGQGPILTTPLQIATLYATIANGGRRVEPFVYEGNAAPPTALDYEDADLERVQEALWAVVNDRGTAAASRLADLEISGKTGTAQVIEQKTWIDSDDLAFEHRDHAWFASYAPSKDPELVVVAFIEHGGHGSSVAAPMVKALYRKHFGLGAQRVAGGS